MNSAFQRCKLIHSSGQASFGVGKKLLLMNIWRALGPSPLASLGTYLGIALALPGHALASESVSDSDSLDEVVVTASRVDLLGTATTASQGSVTQQELDLRPAYRVGQLLESVPGLVVTIHSGEGKANQYLARGFNLDHGTDIANFVDDMPINRPTNTHGQGYSDLNFLLSDVTEGLDYTKGPYYASVGDFGSVVSTHLKLANDIPAQVSVTGGTLGVYNVFAGGTDHLSDTDRVLGGVVLRPCGWTVRSGQQFPQGSRHPALQPRHPGRRVQRHADVLPQRGQADTDQPLRAIQEGLISRFGTLDPSDGNASSASACPCTTRRTAMTGSSTPAPTTSTPR